MAARRRFGVAAGEAVAPDPELTERLAEAARRAGAGGPRSPASTPTRHDPTPPPAASPRADMQTAPSSPGRAARNRRGGGPDRRREGRRRASSATRSARGGREARRARRRGRYSQPQGRGLVLDCRRRPCRRAICAADRRRPRGRRRSTWSSTSSSRCEKRAQTALQALDVAGGGEVEGAIAACWASIAFSRAPNAAASAFSSIWLSSSAWASSPIACSLRARRPSWSRRITSRFRSPLTAA